MGETDIQRISNDAHQFVDWHLAMGDVQAARVAFQRVMYADAVWDRVYGIGSPEVYRHNRKMALDWFKDQIAS